MIISKDNKQVKLVKSLNLKKNRDQLGLFVVYGDDLVEIALAKKVVKEVLTSNPNKEGTLVDIHIMEYMNLTESPYDILAICKQQVNDVKSDNILVLSDVQDPANVGTLFRSALAFGFWQVILSDKCADIYNEKTIRSSRGAFFDLNIERTTLYERLKKLKEQGYLLIGTSAKGKGNVSKVKANKIAIILGSEGQGIAKELLTLIDRSAVIMTKKVESLNVLVAGSILMYEWMKR